MKDPIYGNDHVDYAYDDDDAPLVSCMEGDDDYRQQSDRIKEQENKVKRGLIWTLGGVGLAALLGLVIKFFNRGSDEDEVDNIGAVVNNITDGGGEGGEGEGGVGGGPTGTEQLPAGGSSISP